MLTKSARAKKLQEGGQMVLKNFFVLEGIDGCGKTTQIEMLRKFFGEERFFFTREPTESETGLFLRKVLAGKFAMSDEALALLFAADRAEHLFGKGGIERQIAAGKKAVCDRYLFSTLSYQSGAERAKFFASLANSAFPLPEKVFFLKISPQKALARINFRNEEREIFESAEKLSRISARYEKIFLDFAQKEPDMKIVEIDATLPACAIFSQISAML